MTDTAADGSATPLRPAKVDRGTNVLIVGPALSRKRELVFDLLAGGGDAAIAVTTKESAARAKESLYRKGEAGDGRFAVVDCVSRQRAVGTVRETDTVSYASSAGDLTGIGIVVSGFMQEFHHTPDVEDAWIGLYSLSTMLMYADIRRVYRFVHVIAGRVQSSDFVGAFTIDSASRDTEAVDRLGGLFDAMIEVRDAEPGQELRVRGGDFGPGGWTPF